MNILYKISVFANQNFLDSFPVDAYLHFMVGLLIFGVVLTISRSVWASFFVVLALAILKEYYDFGVTPNAQLFESIKDVAFSILYPFVVINITKGEAPRLPWALVSGVLCLIVYFGWAFYLTT